MAYASRRSSRLLRTCSDNLLAQGKRPAQGVEYYNAIFTLASVKDEWEDHKQLVIQHVMLRPLQLPDITVSRG